MATRQALRGGKYTLAIVVHTVGPKQESSITQKAKIAHEKAIGRIANFRAFQDGFFKLRIRDIAHGMGRAGDERAQGAANVVIFKDVPDRRLVALTSCVLHANQMGMNRRTFLALDNGPSP